MLQPHPAPGLGVLARLSGQFHQLGAGLAVLIGCLSRGTDRNMLRTVPAPEGIAQVLRQPLRFPGLGDPQVHSRLTFPELLCRFCCRLRQAGHPEPAKFRHLLRGGDVVHPEAEQVEGGKVRQLPELSHSREVLQISWRAPEPQLLQVGGWTAASPLRSKSFSWMPCSSNRFGSSVCGRYSPINWRVKPLPSSGAWMVQASGPLFWNRSCSVSSLSHSS